MTTQLVKYEAACRALADCKAVDEVKAWADKAAAMQAYARMAKDKEMETTAAEIRIRAERRLGEMLSQQKADGGLNSGSRSQFAGKTEEGLAVVANDHQKNVPKLADVGISKDLSSRAQKLAAVPEAEFEAEIGEWRDRVSAEGARVSARLEKKGEKQLKKAGTVEVVEAANEADGGQSLDELIAEIQRENDELHARLKAMEADDAKAELHKALLQRDHAVRQQSEAMDKAHRSEKREAWNKRQLMRCGKAVGQEDPDKIAASVEAFVRQFQKAA